MTTPWWNREVVHVASRERQQDLLNLLHDISDARALGNSSGEDHFVVYECTDWRLKRAIHALFAVTDSASKPRSTTAWQTGGGGVA